MAEPKPLASLSAGLLARKGAARPAMRRQAQAHGLNGGMAGFGNQDDLGWNDMGYDVDPHDNALDHGRSVDHGLSPMSSAQLPHQHVTSDSLPDALDALGEAVDRVMPGHAPAPQQTSTVQSFDARINVPEQAEPPAVREQQARIEQALVAPESVVEPVVEVAREPVADTSIIAPVAAPVQPAPVAAVAAPIPAPIIAPTVAAPIAPSAPSRAPSPRVRAGTRGNFAFTLRLDPERHLRLRLASATTNRSAQQIIIQLVDDYLADLPEIDAFAAQVPASKSDR